MCGDLPNDGLNSTVEQLTAYGLNMAQENARQGLIDPLEGLKNSPVMDLVSDRDPIISTAMMEANKNIFTAFSANAKFLNKKTGHVWPNVYPSLSRSKCESNKEQNDNCDYDFSGDMLKHLHFNNTKSKLTNSTWKPKI